MQATSDQAMDIKVSVNFLSFLQILIELTFLVILLLLPVISNG